MKRVYCHCGAPLWPTYTVDGAGWCRICWVMGAGSLMSMGAFPAWTSFPPTQRLSATARVATDVDDCNSTDGTAALSTWLPPGAVRLQPIPEDSVTLSGDLPRLQATLWRMSPRDTHPAPRYAPQPRRLDTAALAEALETAYPGTRWFAWHDQTRLAIRLQARRGGLAVDGLVSMSAMDARIMDAVALQAERMAGQLDAATIPRVRFGGAR